MGRYEMTDPTQSIQPTGTTAESDLQAAPAATSTSTPWLSYWTVQPNQWTFEADKIREWVSNLCAGRVLNTCTGPTRLDYDGPVVTNDIDPDIEADLHVDVSRIDDHIEPASIDTIVHDPPFTDRQAEVTYGAESDPRYGAKTKTALDRVLKPGGRIIQFGYQTTVMPVTVPETPYRRIAVALWNALGRQYDYLSAVAEKPGNAAMSAPLPGSASDETSSELSERSAVAANVTETVPNSGADKASVTNATATSGNGGSPIRYQYLGYTESHSLVDIIERAVGEYAVGSALAISGNKSPRIRHTGGTVIQNTLTTPGVDRPLDEGGKAILEGEDRSHAESSGLVSEPVVFEDGTDWPVDVDPTASDHIRTRIHDHAVTNLSEKFTDTGFDTVLLDLPPKAFQATIDYDRSTTGLDTAMKQELHPLIDAGDRVIQIGHTVTLMPDRLQYTRKAITQIAHPDAEQDILVTVDTKQHAGLGTYGSGIEKTPRDIRYEETEASGRYRCVQCDDRWYLHPAWYVFCPECGAAPANFCLFDDGDVRRIPHPRRIHVFTDQHECDQR